MLDGCSGPAADAGSIALGSSDVSWIGFSGAGRPGSVMRSGLSSGTA
jgi:hypothetical protein